MIPVKPAPEPASFDTKVRRPGTAYLEGQTPPLTADRTYWTRAIEDMRRAYDDTCSYLGMRIEPSTAFATVDHFVPRKLAPELAYEWSNLRLAAQTVNTYKRTSSVPVDPFTVEPGEFTLNLLSGEVEVGSTRRPQDVAKTIEVLRLNDSRFVTSRRGYIDAYLAGDFSRAHLARWFPFVEAELTRQGH